MDRGWCSAAGKHWEVRPDVIRTGAERRAGRHLPRLRREKAIRVAAKAEPRTAREEKWRSDRSRAAIRNPYFGSHRWRRSSQANLHAHQCSPLRITNRPSPGKAHRESSAVKPSSESVACWKGLIQSPGDWSGGVSGLIHPKKACYLVLGNEAK